jgi:hypothetical protein
MHEKNGNFSAVEPSLPCSPCLCGATFALPERRIVAHAACPHAGSVDPRPLQPTVNHDPRLAADDPLLTEFFE